MNIKFYITSLLYLLVANGAKVLNHYLINEHPTAYLRWIQQFQHIPEMNWLNQSPYTQKRPFNQQNFLNSIRPVEFPYGYRNNNVQTINRVPQSYGNYCNQPLLRFPPYQGYSTNRNTAQFYIRQPVPSRPISQPNYTVMSQQRINADKPIQKKSLDFLSQTKINQPMYPYSPNTHQKMQPMMCVPVNSEREIEKLEREETTNETDEELQDDFIPNSHKNESYEHNNHSPGIDEVDQEENTDRPKIKYTEHLHSHQTENNTSQRQPESETVLRKKKRRRKRNRGIRINKKTEGELLKGVHIAEDVAASGALGPQMKADAIAAKAAETAIKGAIKGESAEEIMKKTGMTVASAAIGASTKAQMMNQVAERQPGSETVPLIVNNVNHTLEHKNELRKKKRRRKRHRGIRINKKIGGKLLKGVHIAEDLAASGALGPQMKAAAIAAKAAETAIKGAIKGESAEEIMKKTAMTAASAAIGGSTKAQMMSQVAAQSGIPVPPEMNSSGASTGGPLGIAGGGNLKQQMINQAGQQAMILAMNEVTKKANGNQTVQTPDGP